MTPILGIDLGTTNSCAAVVESSTPLVVPIHDGGYSIPSVVAFCDGRCIVGEVAKRQSVHNARNTITAVKRLIGRSFDDPDTQRAIGTMSYGCVAGPSGDVRVIVGERVYAIPEISALVLAEIKQAAERHVAQVIEQAVITVPAYFNDRQRQATKDAGRIAGLEVIQVVNEPTAAALAYGFHQGAERRVAVYDLGGGTFDVSVLKVGGGAVEVLATAGDAFLGGCDFDNRIFDWLVQQIETTHGVKVASNPDTAQRLREAAEAAKIRLSDEATTKIVLPFLAANGAGDSIHLDCELDRQTLDALVADLVKRTISLFTEAIGAARLQAADIDEVLLVGGMTCMPAVREQVRAVVGCQPASGVHPDLVVAVGAAVQAALLARDVGSTILLDVTPHNLGLLTVAGMAETIIPKNTKVPAKVERRFTTARDGQTTVKIVIYQGDSRKIENNQVLGELLLDGLRPAPRGEVQVDVRFSISADGIVHVTATNVDSGEATELEIAGSNYLGEYELTRMIADHQQHLMEALDRLGGDGPTARSDGSGQGSR